MPTPQQKTVCVRGLDAALYARVKAQAKAEGMLVREWIERAFTNELVRVRREQMRTEERIGEGAGWNGTKLMATVAVAG